MVVEYPKDPKTTPSIHTVRDAPDPVFVDLPCGHVHTVLDRINFERLVWCPLCGSGSVLTRRRPLDAYDVRPYPRSTS